MTAYFQVCSQSPHPGLAGRLDYQGGVKSEQRSDKSAQTGEVYMITRGQVDQAIAGWQEPYVDFLSRHAALWRTWAEQSDSMVAGKQVRLEDVPDFFKSDYEWADVVLDMGGEEQFNWNDPRIARLFAKAVTDTVLQAVG